MDCLQSNLSFNKTCPQRLASLELGAGHSSATGADVDTDLLDAVALLTEVRSSLRSINSKIDTLAHRLDRMHDRVDKHEGILDQVEQRVSPIEDEAAPRNKQLLCME